MMTIQSRAQRCAARLQDFGRTKEPDALASQFVPRGESTRPEIEHSPSSGSGPHAFWKSYLLPLASIRSDFIRVSEADDLAGLEWQSRGELPTGRPIGCRDVSLLTYGEENAITRLAADFDTAAFTNRMGAP